MATLTKEESEQMAKLLNKLGIREPVGIETLTDLTKVLPRVKRKRKRSKRKNDPLELASTLMKKMRKGRERPPFCQN